MHYLYTGDFNMDSETPANLDKVIEILGVADSEFLDDVSFVCTNLMVLGQNVVRTTPDSAPDD